jgi:hypothetical protein
MASLIFWGSMLFVCGFYAGMLVTCLMAISKKGNRE